MQLAEVVLLGPGRRQRLRRDSPTPTHIAIRDSKTPSRATLTFSTLAFTSFLAALKTRSRT